MNGRFIQMNLEIPVYLKVNLVVYFVLIIFSIALIVKNRTLYSLFTADYWKFIFTPVKMAVFVIGLLMLILPVRYLELSSWNYPIAIFQPVLSYLTAPWAVGAIYRSYKKRAQCCELFLAICMMLFTGSWSVEIYILIRDGHYMSDWIFNIPVGIICYSVVGLLWNVEWTDGQGYFAFAEKSKSRMSQLRNE